MSYHRSSTIHGQGCSPLSDSKRAGSGGSCYTKEQLLKLARAYNDSGRGDRIPLSGNKAELWSALDSRMRGECSTEHCWMDKTKVKFTGTFRPKRPGSKSDPYTWLSTDDIHAVLKQYEAVYPDFLALGPYPIDFCNIGERDICNINLWKSRNKGIRRIGVVFNTDPSTQPGQHWVSMFIDISAPSQEGWEVAYFDSYGKAKLPGEIRYLVQLLRAQAPQINVKMNCGDNICTVTKRHQTGGSECGVYSLYFISERLKGRKWEDIVERQRIPDEQMQQLRSKYFRSFL